MSILAIGNIGREGFLQATTKMAERSHRIANLSSTNGLESAEAVEDLALLKLDESVAKANLKSISISDNLLRELVDLNRLNLYR